MGTPNRNSIIQGAGAVKIGSVQMYSKGDIDASLDPQSFEIIVSGYGAVDQRLADSVGKITFTPSGRCTAGILAALYPYQTPVIDSAVFPAADVATEIHAILGSKVVFHNTAVTAMPALKLSAKETVFAGNVELMCLPKLNTERSAANSIFTGPTTAAFTTDLDYTAIKTLPYAATWGTGGTVVNIDTKDGWTVEFDVSIEPFVVSDYGTLTARLRSVTARAKCQPVSHAEDLLALMQTQGSTAAIGSSMRQGKDLRIVATGGLDVSLYDAVPMTAPLKWGESQLRAGELGFTATRKFASGVPGALFSVAMQA
jgi:hypothetical protein